jgi:truncated hemoglobin YjbI
LNLGVKLDEYFISQLVERFYTKVLADKERWFRDMFKSDFESMAQNLSDFLVQRLGGTPFYSQAKGHPALGQRHRYFEMSARAAERWLFHMEQTLDDCREDELEESDKIAILDYLRYTAYFLVSVQEQQWEHSQQGTADL